MDSNITSAAGWAKKNTGIVEEVRLPSGAIIKVRRTPISALLMADLMPLSLLSSQPEKEADTAMSQSDNMAVVKGFKKITRLIVKSVISPKIVFDREPENHEISADDIPAEDMEFLMGFVLRTEEAEALKDFREERPVIDAGQPMQTLQPVASTNGGPV